MTYNPFWCDHCWGEFDHSDHCPQRPPSAEEMRLRAVLADALQAQRYAESYVP